jgi:hypothetical protein
VKRAIRQRDGFGCVICASAIYTYEHIDPEFTAAKAHEATRMALLCGSCHLRVTKGLLSKDTVLNKTLSPAAQEQGFSFGPLDFGTNPPTIVVGSLRALNVPVVLRVAGDDILKVEAPEEPGTPFRVSARLANSVGTEVLRIDRNEWATPTSNWDVKVEGARITINDAPRQVALVLRADPPHSVVLERLSLIHKGVKLVARNGSELSVTPPGGGTMTTSRMEIDGAAVAIEVRADGGMTFGVGGGSMSFTGTYRGPGPKALPRSFRRVVDNPGRNAPCTCGSGRKYKLCCGA